MNVISNVVLSVSGSNLSFTYDFEVDAVPETPDYIVVRVYKNNTLIDTRAYDGTEPVLYAPIASIAGDNWKVSVQGNGGGSFVDSNTVNGLSAIGLPYVGNLKITPSYSVSPGVFALSYDYVGPTENTSLRQTTWQYTSNGTGWFNVPGVPANTTSINLATYVPAATVGYGVRVTVRASGGGNLSDAVTSQPAWVGDGVTLRTVVDAGKNTDEKYFYQHPGYGRDARRIPMGLKMRGRTVRLFVEASNRSTLHGLDVSFTARPGDIK